MPIDPTPFVTATLGGLALLVVAVRREVLRDGLGVRPGPRSRQDAAAGAIRPLALPRPRALLDTGRLLVGLLLYGVAIALILRAGLGVGPWDVLAQGLSRSTGVPFGLVTNGIGAALLLLWIPLRQRPGAGTLLNVLLVGTAAQVALDLTTAPTGLPLRVALLGGGMMLLAVATAVYVGAGLGAGPRDGLMLGLHRRLGWPVWFARAVVEGSALATGWLLGGDVGIGTVVFALGIGPLCGATIRLLAPAQLRRR